jgi:ribulose-phosphate 3-epimerase
MKRKMVSVSILGASDKLEAVRLLNGTSSDFIHIDVMDGEFVANKAFSMSLVRKINRITEKRMDVHLMVRDVEMYVKRLRGMNIGYVTFHIEAVRDMDIGGIIGSIREMGYGVGVSIKPDTDVDVLKGIIDIVDLVLVMSVEPGKGGQEFMIESVARIKAIRRMRRNVVISVDGGINDMTSFLVDTDMVVVGSYVTSGGDFEERIERVR